MDYKQFINDWKINKTMLAEKIGMPIGTFANKISDNPLYSFTIDELEKIKSAIDQMIEQFKTVSFYNLPTPQQLNEAKDSLIDAMGIPQGLLNNSSIKFEVASTKPKFITKRFKASKTKTKVVKVTDLNKQALGEKIYSPMDNPLFRAKNRIK